MFYNTTTDGYTPIFASTKFPCINVRIKGIFKSDFLLRNNKYSRSFGGWSVVVHVNYLELNYRVQGIFLHNHMSYSP